MGTDDTPPAAPTEHASSDLAHEPGNKAPKNNHGGKKRDSQWAKDRQGKGKKSGGKFGGKKQVYTEQDRDAADENRAAKRRRVIAEQHEGSSYMSIAFTPEEIAAEERKPKRKVAVLVGYAGTGYHGLQINHSEKTIEGDLFSAFVKAGAIAKTNADDPKKSSLVRCARTDKGVHAAGNVLSLKLIIEDDSVVDKINEHLPEQIRVWSIQRTQNSFSAYQAVDSRWYEYLMPSYSLLPPHPDSFLGKKMVELGTEKGTLQEYLGRLDDVNGFWEEVIKKDIQPILDALDPELRKEVLKVMYMAEDQELDQAGVPVPTEIETSQPIDAAEVEKAGGGQAIEADPAVDAVDASIPTDHLAPGGKSTSEDTEVVALPYVPTPVEKAVKELKAAYVAAKRRYRVTPARLEKLQAALNAYTGTHNFHNFTVEKKFNDPSAKRNIFSFVLNPQPIPIRDTEWLSLKVHGQSFMMHQIRKMVGMAVMVTRCGAPVDLISQSYGSRRISIPKAPGLGLMLERPVFNAYNKKLAAQSDRELIDFAKYEEKIQEFKDREIHGRMFEAEEKENAFHNFFHQLDNYRTDFFLWVTPGGFEAAHERVGKGTEKIPKQLEAELGDEKDGIEE